METRKFGKTGIDLNVLGLGTYGHGNAYGGIAKQESIEIVKTILNSVPNNNYFLIDTAPLYGYGECERWIGEVLASGHYKNVLIATKAGRDFSQGNDNKKNFTTEFLKKELRNSLERTGLNKAFLYQLHNPGDEIYKSGEVFDLLESFRIKGFIDYYGISINHPEEGLKAIEYCTKNNYSGFVSLQVIYNILNREMEKTLFKIARQNNIAIIAREPLQRGFLTDRKRIILENELPVAINKIVKSFGIKQLNEKIEEIREVMDNCKINYPIIELALKFILSNNSVSVVIPGINRIKYVKDFIDFNQNKLEPVLFNDLKKIKNLQPI